MAYYFDKPYVEEFECGRIRAIDGDVTDRALVAGLEKECFDIRIGEDILICDRKPLYHRAHCDL